MSRMTQHIALVILGLIAALAIVRGVDVILAADTDAEMAAALVVVGIATTAIGAIAGALTIGRER